MDVTGTFLDALVSLDLTLLSLSDSFMTGPSKLIFEAFKLVSTK